MRQVDAIFTADWHLRDSQPTSRIDDFYNVQWEKLKYITLLQKKYDCPIYHSGDLFDTWKPSPMLIAKVLQYLPNNFHTIYGNHDLPQHNLQLAHKTGIHVLEAAEKLKVLNGCHWNEQPDKEFIIIKGRKILIWHVMTYQGKKPWHDCTDPKSARLLRAYKDYDVIVTGHNHLTFVEEHKGRILVNPGSIFRMSIAHQTHRPAVFLYNADSNTVEPVYLPIVQDVFDVRSKVQKEQRNERIIAFIEKLNTDFDNDISFEKNINKFLRANEIDEQIKSIIYTALE